MTPNDSHDWINQRDPAFDKFITLGDKEGESIKAVFDLYSLGIKTNRDPWTYNFSSRHLSANMSRMIDFYNAQARAYKAANNNDRKQVELEEFIDNDPKKISWSANLKNDLEKFVVHDFEPESLIQGMYRPFCKQWTYFSRRFVERVYQMPKVFPGDKLKNLLIVVSGIGASKGFSALVTDVVPNLHMHDTGQCFPLYSYYKMDKIGGLFESTESGDYMCKENVSDAILHDFRQAYGAKVSKEDVFYYVYSILHSPEYKRRFEADLQKMLPRIPFAQDFWAFSIAGRDLAYWHLNYESIDPYPLEEFSTRMLLNQQEDYRVQQMRFGKRGKEEDRSTIIYNSNISLLGIPLEAYDYIVNGKSALEWIMDRYELRRDKDSQITNDPNDWSDDPRYIIDLVKRIVRVSLETMKIVKALPDLNERK